MEKLKNISVLIKPSSSMCNLRCRYCFYIDVSKNRNIENYGFITEETSKNLINEIFDVIADDGIITFNFQGGEPTLIGLDYYEFFTNEVYERIKEKNIKINFAIQTNGTLIDEEWAKFFYENKFLVGISLDGFEENNNYFRLDKNGRVQFNKTMEAIKILEKYNVQFNILTVLTNSLSHYPEDLYHFYKKNNFEYIQLISCLSPLGEDNKRTGLKPKNFSKFYKKLFDIWYEDEKRINITLFNDVFPMLIGIPPMTCGMLGFCAIQLVIEADGGVYPCDFYVIDKYRIGNINEDSIFDIVNSEKARKFINEPKRFSSLCKNCRFINICNGNCKRLNISMFEKDYCGYKDFLEYSLDRGYEIIKEKINR